ncbi:DUF6455 family protein [Roseobacteraceae bacterium NS-SX3]
MGLFAKLGRSTDLVQGMAGRLGIDYGEIVARDPETEGQKFRRAVMRCSHCSNQDGCTDLQNASSELPDTPSYCQNRDLFAQMRKV